MRFANLDGRLTLVHGATDDPLRAPSPRPAQIFGIGVNYADHGAEAAMEIGKSLAGFAPLGTMSHTFVSALLQAEAARASSTKEDR